jgi:hypothetical protein
MASPSLAHGCFDGYRLCPDLKPKEFCVVVEQYKEGNFERLFHTHISARRISSDNRRQMLKSLVAAHTPLWFDAIVTSFVNDRPGYPRPSNYLAMHVSCPERGVLRTYCGGNTKSWIDEVIAPQDFRANQNPSEI